MKYLVIFAAIISIGCSGCFKDPEACKNVTPASEEAAILAYATSQGITATKHSSGLYYQIMNPGSGASPVLSSNVTVTYTGKLLNGTLFDQNLSGIKFLLGNVIEGWQIGVPLIKKGGKIKLIVPSALAYGCNGAGSIPSNSILFFEIDLLDIQ